MRSEQQLLLAGIPEEHIKQAGPIGLELQANIKVEDWSELITRLACNAKAVTSGTDTVAAWLGDVLAYKQGKYRGQISALARAAGLHPTTLRNAKMVCRRIPLSCRRDTLSWSHHCEIAKVFSTGEDIARWLDQAEKGRWSKMELRRQIAESRCDPESATPSVPPTDSAHFGLLRELLAAERMLRLCRNTWRSWPPKICRLTSNELPTLLAFTAELRAESRVHKDQASS